MQNGSIYVSELSTTTHRFLNDHFCRGNSSRRKTRIGLIEAGRGTYIYLNRELEVQKGDVVFVPENIYCYSRWSGTPEIRVTYVSCFLHYENFRYQPQIIGCGAQIQDDLLRVSGLLSQGYLEELEAYSIFYRILQKILPHMIRSDLSTDKTLRRAVEYITDNWDRDFSIRDVARECCVSESAIYTLFRRELGQTPVKFWNAIKINHAIQYLENSNYSVATISRLACFHSENHFRKVFADATGMTPLKFRKNS